MKTLQKYTNIALFLISATAMIPTYANQEDITESQKAETVWYKRPEVHAKIGNAIIATVYFAGLCAVIYYVGKKNTFGPITDSFKDPFDIRLMNVKIETDKLLQNYLDDLQMSNATVLELPSTHKSDFLKAITAVFKKYGMQSKSKLYTLVDDSTCLYSNISRA